MLRKPWYKTFETNSPTKHMCSHTHKYKNRNEYHKNAISIHTQINTLKMPYSFNNYFGCPTSNCILLLKKSNRVGFNPCFCCALVFPCCISDLESSNEGCLSIFFFFLFFFSLTFSSCFILLDLEFWI